MLFLILHINITTLNYFVKYFNSKFLKKLLSINNIIYLLLTQTIYKISFDKNTV